MDPVGELVVVPLPAQVLAGRDVRVAVRQIVHALVVVPGRPHHHQAVLDRGRLEQLVGRIDPLPQRVHRPGQDDDGGERGDRLDDERARTPHREERETREEEPEPDRRRSPEEADREHEGDAHEASEQVQAVGGQVLAALHRPPAELAHGNEGERGQQENDREEPVDRDPLGRGPGLGHPHVELLGERQDHQAGQPRRLHPETDPDEQAELDQEQRRGQDQRYPVARGERVAEPESREARQQPKILVEGEVLENRTLPPDDGELEEQAERGAPGDGGPDPAFRQRIRERGLRTRDFVQPRLEAPECDRGRARPDQDDRERSQDVRLEEEPERESDSTVEEAAGRRHRGHEQAPQRRQDQKTGVGAGHASGA